MALAWDRLTRFEKARIIGARALQISMGAPILIGVSEKVDDPIEIARLELEKGVVPITVVRTLPDGTKQTVDVKKLIKAEKEFWK